MLLINDHIFLYDQDLLGTGLSVLYNNKMLQYVTDNLITIQDVSNNTTHSLSNRELEVRELRAIAQE